MIAVDADRREIADPPQGWQLIPSIGAEVRKRRVAAFARCDRDAEMCHVTQSSGRFGPEAIARIKMWVNTDASEHPGLCRASGGSGDLAHIWQRAGDRPA